jgi:hypothetical protein
MEFFALPARISCPDSTGRARQRRKKPPVFFFRKQQLQASYETTTPNSIDMLRDGTSFPEICGEMRDIGMVSDTVKWADAFRFIGTTQRLAAIPRL